MGVHSSWWRGEIEDHESSHKQSTPQGSGDFAVFNAVAGDVELGKKFVISDSPEHETGEDPVGVWTDDASLEEELVNFIKQMLSLP